MLKQLYRLPLMLFMIPFVYLSLWLDTYFQSVLGFFFSLVLAVLLGFYFKASKQLHLWAVGNIVSTLISLLLQHQHPEWHFHYQPFNPTLLVLSLSLLYLIPQLFGIFWAKVLRINLAQDNHKYKFIFMKK